MLANIRIATIVGLMAIFGLVNAAEQKTPRGWWGKPKPKPKPKPDCGIELPSLPPPLGRQWANEWDGNMYFSCRQPGTAISSIFSVWAADCRDRRWSFSCSAAKSGLSSVKHSTWDGGFINEWDGCLFKMCGHNAFICGITSEHDNFKEDRRFKVECCTSVPKKKKLQLVLTDCEDVKLNDFQEKMNYNIPETKVLQGLYSEHRDDKEDREWHAIICSAIFVRGRKLD